MILFLDNYDSFVYNLYQLIGTEYPDIEVVRNDALTLEQIAEKKPEALVISPGPGRPDQAGICLSAIRTFAGKIPILGICLGEQAICEAFGATVTYAKQLMHGKSSLVYAEPDSVLFRGLENPFPAARYHSLAVDPKTVPACLRVTAKTEDGEIMAVESESLQIYGMQFHPESVLTPDGRRIIQNFLKKIQEERHD
ncbi:anthranilate synthase component II [Hominifimenecus sp. rT4P-3]|uniref:anthranilate synthase component II n=1 Tax=Hominifimenecus sp. rT4P-3 TaxID=3242979 RepID=UPI003DA4195D